MVDDPVWLRLALLSLAVVAVLVGAIELALIAIGRRRPVPGYGWETEATHLAMNAIMAAMVTSLWSPGLARGSAIVLGAAALLLVVVSTRRVVRARTERELIVIATAIHVVATSLMAWLVLRMAPSHAMTMPHRGIGWFGWPCAAIFLFDLAGVLVVTAFADRFPARFRSGAARVSILPHVAMDVGMLAMLVSA